MSNLPYWTDQLETFYYLPDNKLITLEDAYQGYGMTSTSILTCKAWWNTNIPMEGFVPVLIPAIHPIQTGQCLRNFIERIEQRSSGNMCPAPPMLTMKAGLLMTSKETGDIKAISITKGGESEIIRIVISDDCDLICNEMTFTEGEVVPRNEDWLYWNIVERKYV